MAHLKKSNYYSLMNTSRGRRIYSLVSVDTLEKTNLIVIEDVKGAIVCLKVLEDANSLLAEPALGLLGISLEIDEGISIFSKAILA